MPLLKLLMGGAFCLVHLTGAGAESPVRIHGSICGSLAGDCMRWERGALGESELRARARHARTRTPTRALCIALPPLLPLLPGLCAVWLVIAALAVEMQGGCA